MLFNEIFFENNQPVNDLLHIRQMGKLLKDSTYHIEREESPTIVIASILSGILHLKINDTEYTLQTGHSMILPNQIKYEFYSDSENPCQMIWINIRGRLIEHMYEGLFSSKSMVIANHNIEKDYKELQSFIIQSYDQQHQISKIVSRLMIDLHQFEVESTSNIAPQKQSSAYEYYLSECIQTGFNLKAMAKYFHLSTDTLNRHFKKIYDTTPYQYYQSIRIDLAISLLAHTDLTIEDISSRLGFSNRNHFTTFFIKHKNIPPATFRKNKQE